MKRHAVTPDLLEAGRQGARGSTVSMVPPHIQPYQAAGPPGKSSGPTSTGGKGQRDSWQQVIALGVAVWFGGWFLLGYSMLWPVYVVLNILSWALGSTPLQGLSSWWDRGLPNPDVFPPATELRLPANQVAHYVESYAQTYGEAALIFAAHDGYAQLVNGLLLSRELGYGDLIDAADESGRTALLYAAGRGFQQVATVLLHGGADPDAPRQGKGGHALTPLMEAAGTGHREIVTLLLRANATLDLRDEDGNTALMYAAHGGHLGAVQELLQRGAMRSLANTQGSTALAMATAKGHQAVVDALQRGARPVVESPARRSRLDNLVGHRATETKRQAPETPGSNEEEEAPPVKASKAKEVKEIKSQLASALSKVTGGSASTANSATDSGNAAAEKRAKQLEAELTELKRTQEASDLKSQRRIVELLEKSQENQRLLDEAERERREAEKKAEDLRTKLTQREAQGLEDEQRHARLSKEAHEARLEAERERSRADAAERDAARRAESEKRLQEQLRQGRTETQEQTAQAERLQQQLRSLRAEVDRSEDERRRLQHRLDEQRAGAAVQDSPAAAIDDVSHSSSSPMIPAAPSATAVPEVALSVAAAPALPLGASTETGDSATTLAPMATNQVPLPT